MNFINDRPNVKFVKPVQCGDKQKAERVFFWLVHYSF